MRRSRARSDGPRRAGRRRERTLSCCRLSRAPRHIRQRRPRLPGRGVGTIQSALAGTLDAEAQPERPRAGAAAAGPSGRARRARERARAVRAGVWQSPGATPTHAEQTAGAEGVPTFHEYASWWLQAKVDGLIGHKPIDATTRADYRWRLTAHLLPFFGGYRLDDIDRRLCLAFKETKLREAEELRAAIAAGVVLRDRHGRRLKPMGLASIKKLIETLAAILDEAIEDEHIERNRARGRAGCASGRRSRRGRSWRWTSSSR
jgi:hypothetical protein